MGHSGIYEFASELLSKKIGIGGITVDKYVIIRCIKREITLIGTAKTQEIAYELMKSSVIEYLMSISKSELIEIVGNCEPIRLENFELSEMTAWSNIEGYSINWKILNLSEEEGVSLVRREARENDSIFYQYAINEATLTFNLYPDGSIRRLNVSGTPEGFGVRVSCRPNENYDGKLYPHLAVISLDGQIISSDEEEREFWDNYLKTKAIAKKIDLLFVKGKFD